MTMLIGAFPDLRFTTELMVAGNDLVSAFTKVSGTNHNNAEPRANIPARIR